MFCNFIRWILRYVVIIARIFDIVHLYWIIFFGLESQKCLNVENLDNKNRFD
jgi:hypothetical protein